MNRASGRLAAGPLAVQFRQQGDRVGHALLLVDGGRETVLAESLEGDGQQDWPPSPPLQQLSWETGPDGGRCALLVGMAGISHWSASVVAVESALRFELACRVKQPPELLASSYRAVEGIFEINPPRSSASSAVDPAEERNRGGTQREGQHEQRGDEAVLVCAARRLVVRPIGRTSLSVQGDRLLLAAVDSPAQVPDTVCWGYELRIR